MAIKITMYVIKANITVCCISSSFICQDSSFTLPPPQFPCCHLLATGIKMSTQYRYRVWPPIRVLPNTQYYQYWKILGNTQYPNANIVLTLVLSALSTIRWYPQNLEMISLNSWGVIMWTDVQKKTLTENSTNLTVQVVATTDRSTV